MKKQTAVEYFNEEILVHLNFDQRLYLKDIFDKAKEMEKQQIIGDNWQAEQNKNKFSEEDMLDFAWFLVKNIGQYSCDEIAHFEGKYLEQFKNK